jgi:NCS1 family nucleobase:cation symporter-1
MSDEARFKEEAVNGRLPLLPSEREYSTRGILATGFSYAVAAWCFLIGGYAAAYVGAVHGVVTLVAGCVVGVALSAAAAALACNRYGLEQIDYTKTCFGQRGAKLILVFYVLNQIGWTGMILVMFGSGLRNVAAAFGLQGGEWMVRLAVLGGLVIAYAIILKGVHVLNVFNAIITPGLLLATALLFYAIFRGDGWARLQAAQPIGSTGDGALDYIIAFELGLGAGFSWWPGIGFLARNTDTQRNSLYPQILTMGLGMGIVCCSGLLAGLLYQVYDPTVWMIRVGGRLFGAAALFLVAIANLAASAIMMYTAALGLRHIRALRAMPWRWLTLVSFLPLAVYVIWPLRLYEKGSSFLAYNATVFAPISAVLLVDYFFLRRGRINVSQVFEDDRGHYHYLFGFNVAALICAFGGMLLYNLLLDPATFTPRGPVRQLTATAPSILVPMLAYYLLARFWLIPRGLGGYRAPLEAVPLRRPNL